MSWKASINQAFGSVRIADIAAYTQQAPASNESAIDRFYHAIRTYNTIGSPTVLATQTELGPLLFLGLISSTENYLREIFASLLRVCRVSRKKSADNVMKMGSVFWHLGGVLELAAFEHLSFAGADEIKKACQNFLKFNVGDSSPLAPPLSEFDKLCELRHSIVHANGFIAGKNAIALSLPPANGRLAVSISYPQIQEAASICMSLVTSLNTELFAEVAKRWAIEWRAMPDWIPANEELLFAELFALFHSVADARSGSIPNPMTLDQCRENVKRTFGLI